MMSSIQDTNNSLDTLNLLPAKKQLDFIINHHAPRKLVQRIPTPHLLLIIRDVGAESALELVEMLHPTQVQELLDLDAWSNDELNPRALAHYFSVLFEANPETAVTQIYHLDMELIGVMFKMASTIYDVSEGEEPEDYSELYSSSPDGRFLVCFSDDENMSGLGQMLHTFLEQMYGRDMALALTLLENIRFEMVSGLEEASLRWRQNRLLDFGILPREERLHYFASMTPADMHKLAPRISYEGTLEKHALVPMTVVHTNKLADFLFLDAALAHATDDSKDNFWQSLVYATANMHASLSGDFGDRDDMAATAHYVKFLVDAGLFQSCRGVIADVGAALNTHSTKTLIRLGRTLLTTLRKRLMMKMSDELLLGHDFCHVDSPLREAAKALALPEPRFYEGLSSANKLTVRYFANLREVTATNASINEIHFRARFCGALGIGITMQALTNRPELSHANMVARALINAYLGNDDILANVSNNDLHKIFTGNDLHHAFTQFADTWVSAIAAKLSPGGDDDDKAHNFKNAVLIQLTQNRALLAQ